MLKRKAIILLCYTAFILLSQSLKANEPSVTSFQVQVEGKGKAIILIPGLMSDQRLQPSNPSISCTLSVWRVLPEFWL